MAKTSAERQRAYRINLSKDKVKYDEAKKKSRLRDNNRRKKMDPKKLQQLRLRQKEASKNYREKLKLKRLGNKQPSTYTNRQTVGKAVQRVLRVLPKDPNKRHHIVHHVAELLDVVSKPADKHKREQRSLSKELKAAVIQFYNRDDISYQMPGKRDCIVVEDDDGKKISLQKRILLFSIRETLQLFLDEKKNVNHALSLTSFGELRPKNVLIQSHMSHRSCLCIYHENIYLLLKPLSKIITCPALNSLQAFSSALVCDEANENCMFSKCSLCSNNFDLKIRKHLSNHTKQIEWHQWTMKTPP